MFERRIYCDKCKKGFYVENIVSKWMMVNKARELGWTIGKMHLCPNCKRKGKNE